MLTKAFYNLMASDNPEETAKKIKVALNQELESLVAVRFEPNRVPREIITGVDGSVWDVLSRLNRIVDALKELAEEVAKYNRDGSLKEEIAPDTETDQPESDEVTAEPSESDK